jgi:hypothetical protein
MTKQLLLPILLLLTQGLGAQTLRLHPLNPRIFQYQGKPTLIIGSGEHYGAVLNLDFDYAKYLQTLEKDGLNTTRIFTGGHRENPGDFGIERNSLGPTGDRFICAWARSNEPGYRGGGSKFDLQRWDEAYFTRLKDFMTQAQQRGIIVEVCLFSAYYGSMWVNNPMHPGNNVNQTQEIDFKKVNTTENGPYWALQEAYVRKMVRELNAFDNFYFEIQNEPWADDGRKVGEWNDYIQPDLLKSPGNHWRCIMEQANPSSLAWQSKIAALIRNEEATLPKKHLISQNYVNFKWYLPAVDPQVDILNFHYAHPEAASWNWHWNKALGCNETGFSGSQADPYRRQAWRFIFAGGALFNNLDYSFTVGNESGLDSLNNAPGHGSPGFRKQLRFLRTFLEGFDLVSIKPFPQALSWAKGVQTTHVLRDGRGRYGIYCEGFQPFQLKTNVPAGRYRVEWWNTKTGQLLQQNVRSLPTGAVLESPDNDFQEVALRLQAVK